MDLSASKNSHAKIDIFQYSSTHNTDSNVITAEDITHSRYIIYTS